MFDISTVASDVQESVTLRSYAVTPEERYEALTHVQKLAYTHVKTHLSDFGQLGVHLAGNTASITHGMIDLALYYATEHEHALSNQFSANALINQILEVDPDYFTEGLSGDDEDFVRSVLASRDNNSNSR